MKSLILILIAIITTEAIGQRFQVPASVLRKNDLITEKLRDIIEVECPKGQCQLLGCEAADFAILDLKPDSELPGLESEATQNAVQYKLKVSRCEFTYEPSISEAGIQAIRSRVTDKIKVDGVRVVVRAKKLSEKPEDLGNDFMTSKFSFEIAFQQVFQALLPILPWLLTAMVLSILAILLLYAYRKITRKDDQEVSGSASQNNNQSDSFSHSGGSVSSTMVLAHIAMIKEKLEKFPQARKETLRVYLSNEAVDDLCLFIRHFDPLYLEPFKERHEYASILQKVSESYVNTQSEPSSDNLMSFLDKFDRSFVAAQLRSKDASNEAYFAFLNFCEVDELQNLLQILSEEEALITLAYAPKKAREQFFRNGDAEDTLATMVKITSLEKASDRKVRQVAEKVSNLYQQNKSDLKNIKVETLSIYQDALNSLDSHSRQEFINSIRQDNPKLLVELSGSVFLDESLPVLATEFLEDLFLTISPEEAAEYLNQFSWGNKLLSRLNHRLKDHISELKSRIKQPNPSVFERAREKISDYMFEKDRLGTITIRDLNEQILG